MSAFTLFTAAFVMPAEGASAVATVADTSWIAINEILYAAKSDGSVTGSLQATAIGGATSVTLKNLEDTATGKYADNSAPGAVFPIGSKLCPGGMQGPMGAAAGTAMAGDVTGTIGANQITVNSALGALGVGNGTKAISLPKGTDGQILVSDTAAALDLQWKSLLPNTGGTNVADNALVRLDTATGLPIPAQASPMVLTDNAALQTQYGNAKGADAVDIQASHSAVTQVASGQESTISGGRRNTASGAQASIGGGDTNIASAIAARVGGGVSNTASQSYATVGGGNGNLASAVRSTVSGGLGNSATNTSATVGGGENNAASGIASTVAGGNTNLATAANSTIAGGASITAQGIGASVLGGEIHDALGPYSTILGGLQSNTDKHGQVTFSAGRFSSSGDAQVSEFQMRINTTNATPAELKLDGVAAGTNRLTVPNNRSWMFQIMLVARKDDGLTSIYKSEGLITNVAGVVTMPAAATTTEIYDGIGLPATPVVVTADDPNNALIITVTGLAATNIRYLASLKVVEVAY